MDWKRDDVTTGINEYFRDLGVNYDAKSGSASVAQHGISQNHSSLSEFTLFWSLSGHHYSNVYGH